MPSVSWFQFLGGLCVMLQVLCVEKIDNTKSTKYLSKTSKMVDLLCDILDIQIGKLSNSTAGCNAVACYC